MTTPAATNQPTDVRDIYPMPAFATITTPDPQAVADWYAALGFFELFAMPGPDGQPRMIHLRRLIYQDILVVAGERYPTGGAPGLTVSFAAHDDDLEAIAEAARAQGSGRVEGPTVQPWNTIDLRCADPDGNVVVLTKVADRNATFKRAVGELP